MLSKSILTWLMLLTLAAVTRSEHYHIVPVDSIDSCHNYRRETCFTLEQLVQTDLLSGGDNLTLSFLPGDHVLTEQLLICNFSYVYITGQNESAAVVRFIGNGEVHFVSIIELSIERLGFVGVKVNRPRNSHQGLIIDSAHDIYINYCYFTDFELLKQANIYIVKIANTQTATIESTLFMNNIGQVLDIEADDVYITNSEFTKNDGGAVVYIKSNKILISNTEFNYNSAVKGGAVEVESGTVVIIGCNFTNNIASQDGGAIHVVLGSVSISDSELTNSSADMWGGATHVELNGNVSISNSMLTNNSADRCGGAIYIHSGSVSISDSTLTNNNAHMSGGVIYFQKGKGVTISDSSLTNNRANYGGAIVVVSGSVSISDSTLTKNSANWKGGAIHVRLGSLNISDSTLTHNNAGRMSGAIYVHSGSVSISHSTLTKNGAIYEDGAISDITDNYGTIIAVFQSTLIINNTNITDNNGPVYAFDSLVEFNGPTTLSNNRGVLGGSISADQSEIYINTKGVIITNNTATSGGGIFLRESTLFVNEAIKIFYNRAKDGGGIYAFSSRVEFQSVLIHNDIYRSQIVGNIAESGGGIYAIATTIKLTESYVNIDSNTAKNKGGGVYLQQDSKLYLFKKRLECTSQDKSYYVKLMMNKNSAQYGGGIFVADDTESGACKETNATRTIFADCFIQTIKLYEDSHIEKNFFNTFMTNNMATQSGADIYGGLLDRCTVSRNAEYVNSLNAFDYINKTIKFSTEFSISSRSVQVILCNISLISTRKGHTFKISVMAVDQVGNPMNTTIHSSVISESGIDRLKEGQAEQRVGHQCTELEYNVFSQDSSAQVELYAQGPCINLGISRQLINISFELCTCPVGLKPIQSDIECKCDCDPVLQQRCQITNCSEKNGTIKLESNNNIWIGVANTTNGTGFVISNCTFDYCVESPVNIYLSNPDEQCAYNRSGVLCGKCISNFSLVLATSNCKECSNLYLLLLIPFALAGILLVALILMLNITMATGNIHGLIFYANIVAANRANFLARSSFTNLLTIFVSWVNLDLGIETCFYDGMNSQAKVLLQLVFPTYLFLVMFLIITLSKYVDSFSKLLSNRNPVAALGTLVLLSYSKLLRFIIAALQYRVLDYPDDTSDVVWLYDGNVQYFTPNHIPQFVAAAIILIAGGFFTVLLFFGQWFFRCSKVMIWTKNTKYNGFMDAYHAPFTPKHRYWVGLLLFALIVHNLVAAMAPDTYLPVLSSGALSVGLIGWKLLNNRLYKSKYCDSLETLYLFNIAILAFGTSYVKDTKKNQSALASISMAISFTLFVITLCYHFYQFVLKKSNTWLKIEEILGAGAADMRLRRANNVRQMYQQVDDENDDNKLFEAVDDYIQRDPVDLPYTDGVREEVDPDRYITPPIIRPAMRPDQLRLSYMDELAPLITEDYRSARPPPRNNCPVACVVTHSEVGPCIN